MAETVLIVDDHAPFRGFARRLLEAGGMTVIGEAHDGESAIAAARELDPDLVLLDVMLPDTDGFAVAERLTGRARVVLTSSREFDDLRERLARTPADGFVPKASSRRRRSGDMSRGWWLVAIAGAVLAVSDCVRFGGLAVADRDLRGRPHVAVGVAWIGAGRGPWPGAPGYGSGR